jgi:hypothetical protein
MFLIMMVCSNDYVLFSIMLLCCTNVVGDWSLFYYRLQKNTLDTWEIHNTKILKTRLEFWKKLNSLYNCEIIGIM